MKEAQRGSVWKKGIGAVRKKCRCSHLQCANEHQFFLCLFGGSCYFETDWLQPNPNTQRDNLIQCFFFSCQRSKKKSATIDFTLLWNTLWAHGYPFGLTQPILKTKQVEEDEKKNIWIYGNLNNVWTTTSRCDLGEMKARSTCITRYVMLFWLGRPVSGRSLCVYGKRGLPASGDSEWHDSNHDDKSLLLVFFCAGSSVIHLSDIDVCVYHFI